eukprot:TRINITY_DN13694_c0_g1_i2.p1 TRINITY_DN13694_c0_g1~~TRINITY_DN13694_c0_g1_i2.p1  ORF type:complete len:418 (-),score=61.33 TRINITY_DN13694_c0_g1_i2:535-1788(-)
MRNWEEPSLPWHATFTGVPLQITYYWCTNQLIVQRAMGAKTLAEGQKGILFAASMKILGVIMLCIPGIVGAVMVQRGMMINGELFVVKKSDAVYPALVKALMPKWAFGFVAAVCLGSILSTFNSALNSASTLFGLEIYKVYWNREASEAQVVRVASAFGASLTLASIIVAPQLEGVESIFDWLQLTRTFFSLPVTACFVVGIFTTLPDAYAAKFGLTVGAVSYGISQAIPNIHYLHKFFLCFCVALASVAVATYTPCLRKCFGQVGKPSRYVEEVKAVVNLANFPALWIITLLTAFNVVIITVSFQFSSIALFWTFCAMWLFTIVFTVVSPSKRPLCLMAKGSAPEKTEAQKSAQPVLLGQEALSRRSDAIAAAKDVDIEVGQADAVETGCMPPGHKCLDDTTLPVAEDAAAVRCIS